MTPTCAPFIYLSNHLNAHQYKRGQFKGDAPLDPNRRGRSHQRVIRLGDDTMAVRMYSTNLMTITRGGEITLNTDGWHNSPTTRKAMRAAFRLIKINAGLTSARFGTLSQTGLWLHGTTYAYYDGMTLQYDMATGKASVSSELHTFKTRGADREARAALRQAMIDSGFKGMFPVLWAAAEAANYEGMRLFQGTAKIRELVSSAEYAGEWPAVVGRLTYRHRGQFDTHHQAYQALTNELTTSMLKVVDLDVTRL